MTRPEIATTTGRWLPRTLLTWALLTTPAWANGLASEPPLWFEANRPNPQAQQAVTLLNQATKEGLVPAHYQAAELARAVAQARSGPPLTTEQQQSLDAGLTRAMTRYLTDLRIGRVNPRQARANYANPDPRTADTAALLRSAVSAQRLAAVADQLAAEPPMAKALRQALAQYQALAAHPAWQAPLPALPARKLLAGQPYAGLPLLAQRLQALGDLAPNTPVPKSSAAMGRVMRRSSAEPRPMAMPHLVSVLAMTAITMARAATCMLDASALARLTMASVMASTSVSPATAAARYRPASPR